MTKPRRRKIKRVPLNERVRIESLHRFLREESRAAGKGHTIEARERFARRCGTSVQYLTQLALGIRQAQPDIAIRIEKASYGLVRAEDLCSEFDWHYAKLRGLRPQHVVVELVDERPPHEPTPSIVLDVPAPLAETAAA